MFNSAARRRVKRLEQLVRMRIDNDPELLQQHVKQRGIRRLLKIQLVLSWLNWLTVLVFGVLFLADFGLMLIGLQGVLRLVNTARLQAADPTLTLAQWSLFTFVCMVINANRLRNNPSDPRWGQFGFLVPVADSRLIAFRYRNIGSTAFVLAITGGVAFGTMGMAAGWSWVTWVRIVLMLVLTTALASVLTEAIARILTPSPLIRASIVGLILTSLVMGIGMSLASRDWVEMRQAVYFVPLWMLPPGGWLVGMSGLLKPDPLRDWCMPAVGVVVLSSAVRWLPPSLHFNHVQLLQNQSFYATRVGWIAAWQRTVSSTALWSRFQSKPEKIVLAIRFFRELFLPSKSPRVPRVLQALQLSPRGHALLILAKIEPKHVGGFTKYLQGYKAVILAAAIFTVNHFIPLAGVPSLIRLPLLMVPWCAMYRLRDIRSNLNSGNKFRLTHFLFPYRLYEFVSSLLKYQLARTLRGLPAMLIALIILLQTDLPASLILHDFAWMIVMGFQVVLGWSSAPLTATLLGSPNRDFRIAIPSVAVQAAATMMLIQSAFATRFEVAWLWSFIATAVLAFLIAYLCNQIEKRFDVV